MISNEGRMVKEFIRKNSNNNCSYEEQRKNTINMKSVIKFPHDVQVKNINANGVDCELFIPKSLNDNKIIMYFHGGGYVIGIGNNTRSFAAKIANESSNKVLLIDYRLAPENPYPCAHEDVLSVYNWVLNQGVNSSDIVLMGDSSGCGLLLALILKIKESKISMPAAGVLISPLVDYSKSAESLRTKKDVDPYNYDDPFSVVNNFLLDNDVMNPYISPIYGGLTNFPKMLIHASECDVFFSDSINLSRKLTEHGVDVSLKIWEDMWHVFHVSPEIVPESRMALDEIYDFINNI